MIKELHIQNFKRFRNETFRFRPTGVSLLAGGNNSGKSTVLQALAIWEFCRSAIEALRGRKALEGAFHRDPISIGTDDFSPIALPSLSHLWTNLRATRVNGPGEENVSYDLRLTCKWDLPNANQQERELEFGMMLAHDRIYAKPIRSTVNPGELIPKCAYLPPFAGITSREERMSIAAQRRLIGRGLAGAALRNILFDLHQRSLTAFQAARGERKRLTGESRRLFYRSDPWEQLCEVLQHVFRCGLEMPSFDEAFHTTVAVKLFKGEEQSGRFKRYPGYTSRDIMVEGSGFLQWLSVYALAVTSDIGVLLLDEPDAHLHPTLQSYLLERLRSLARENRKQVLLATHSTELLRKVEPEQIFELSANRKGYLQFKEQKIGLFAGLGSEYSPKIDELRRHRRVLFHEGTSDDAILGILAARLELVMPENLVFWQFSGQHKQRRILFELLQAEIPGLRGLSLRDRDSLELAQVDAELRENDYPDANELRFRTWRRRHFENYLILPKAIARASGHTEQDVAGFLLNTWGYPAVPDFTASNCAPALLDARGKEILEEGLPARNNEPARQPVRIRFNCSRHDIAQQMQQNEVPDDVRQLVEELRQMCQV